MILAHNYQVPEVQDVADFVGDSLGLSQQAAATDADVIVFCGVHFMAETAVDPVAREDGAAARPRRRLLARRLDHGRPVARLEGKHPGAVVVMYVNTTAEVKAETDYCVHVRRTPSRWSSTSTASTARTRRSCSARTCSSTM